MDADMIKLSPEDHMDIMKILMQTEKHPEFFDVSQHDIPSEFSSPAGPLTGIYQPLVHHVHNVTAPAATNQNSTAISLNYPNQPVQDPAGPMLESPQPDAAAAGRLCFKGESGLTRRGSPISAYASGSSSYEKRNSMAAMREMIFRIAAMQPIHIDPESIKPPKRRNVKISKDPQSVAARHRRERISERIRILQRLVPGGTKMDTASMLDEAIHYVKFLKKQVQCLEEAAVNNNGKKQMGVGFLASATTSTMMNNSTHSHWGKDFQPGQVVGSMQIFG